jgi:hypothetical protein
MENEAPNLNTGTPWSEDEIRDLYWCIDHRRSVEYIADFLCRTRAEVRAQMADLALEEHKYPMPFPPIG